MRSPVRFAAAGGEGDVSCILLMYVCRRRAVALSLVAVVAIGWSAAASAKCGDAPGDAAAVATTRAAIESACPCAAASDHGAYVRCAKDVVNTAIGTGDL